jgi:hypothetical protein
MLTEDLRSVEFDWHLRVEAGDPSLFDGIHDPDDEAKAMERAERFRKGNFGFQKIEILHEVIGYLDLRIFVPADVAGDVAAAAMNLLAHVDALIIDLRRNFGGEGSMVDFLSSYYFEESTLLSLHETRESKTETWTLAEVPGPRRCETPLFILTSRYTASAAEAFAYGLKHHGKATIIGEKTSGGGHTAFSTRVGDRFNVVIPNGRTIHPVTRVGWNGVGVKPHLEVPEKDALARARAEAIKVLMKKEKNPERKKRFKWILDALEALLAPPVLSEKELEKIAGKYGPIVVELKGGTLFVPEGPGGKTCEVIPMSKDTFVLEGHEYEDRARFVKGRGGKITQLVLTSEDGRKRIFERTGD